MTARCSQVVEVVVPGAPTLGKGETIQVHVRVCTGCYRVWEEHYPCSENQVSLPEGGG